MKVEISIFEPLESFLTGSVENSIFPKPNKLFPVLQRHFFSIEKLKEGNVSNVAF